MIFCINIPIFITLYFQEYATHDLVHSTNKHIAQKYMECKKNKVAIGINDADLTIGSFSRKQHIYSLEFEK